MYKKENNIDIYKLYSKMPKVFKIALLISVIASFLSFSYDIGYKVGGFIKAIL